MKKILFLYKAFPFTIAHYFIHALQKRHDVELTTCGEFYGQWIPWNNGMMIPNKYENHVDIGFPRGTDRLSWKMIRSRTNIDFDAVINVDAQFHLKDKPDIPYIVVGTDPHVLNSWYDEVRPIADVFFNMQKYYLVPGDELLPYACSPDHHYAMNLEKRWDASLIGLHYKQRDDLVDALRRNNISVFYDIGLIWDEYREVNNKSKIGINWSSLFDINARTFEMMAMKQVPVINRLPHLDELGLIEGNHYLGFSSVMEGVEKVKWALANPNEAEAIARSAHELVHRNHTYEQRVQQIFDAVNL